MLGLPSMFFRMAHAQQGIFNAIPSSTSKTYPTVTTLKSHYDVKRPLVLIKNQPNHVSVLIDLHNLLNDYSETEPKPTFRVARPWVSSVHFADKGDNKSMDALESITFAGGKTLRPFRSFKHANEIKTFIEMILLFGSSKTMRPHFFTFRTFPLDDGDDGDSPVISLTFLEFQMAIMHARKSHKKCANAEQLAMYLTRVMKAINKNPNLLTETPERLDKLWNVSVNSFLIEPPAIDPAECEHWATKLMPQIKRIMESHYY